MLRKTSVALAVTTALVPGMANAIPPPPPPQQAIAVAPSGTVWASNGTVLFRPNGTTTWRTLAHLDANLAFGPYALTASRGGWLLRTSAAYFAGSFKRTGHPLTTSAGRGCWQPRSANLGTFFAATRDDAVVDATWACGERSQPHGPQPVFFQPLTGGRWHVLTTVAGTAPPLLAANGSIVAVAAQQSPTRMDVRLINVTSGRVSTRFFAPDAYMQFSSPGELVLSRPTGAPPVFPLEQVLTFGEGDFGGSGIPAAYDVSLYSTTGHRLRSLGTLPVQPLVSGHHLVIESNSPDGLTTTLSLRSPRPGAARPLIAFADPARALVTDGFRWPTLALVETTSTPLPAGEFSCQTGQFGPASAPFVQTLGLAHPGAFIPAPTLPEPYTFPTSCGPVPP